MSRGYYPRRWALKAQVNTAAEHVALEVSAAAVQVIVNIGAPLITELQVKACTREERVP